MTTREQLKQEVEAIILASDENTQDGEVDVGIAARNIVSRIQSERQQAVEEFSRLIVIEPKFPEVESLKERALRYEGWNMAKEYLEKVIDQAKEEYKENNAKTDQ